FDYDGDVDNADFAIFFSNFGKVLAPPQPLELTSTLITKSTATIATKNVWQELEPQTSILDNGRI
ncbi:MAG TPA: hypothetical protein VKK61_03060, partial [Tepidisphaeraceae bacterium]|nr:hypothetical protein [Tepidisphaeraceae bacterium]